MSNRHGIDDLLLQFSICCGLDCGSWPFNLVLAIIIMQVSIMSSRSVSSYLHVPAK